MLRFTFIRGLNPIFLCFKLIIIYYHTQKQRKINLNQGQNWTTTWTPSKSYTIPLSTQNLSQIYAFMISSRQDCTYSQTNTPLGKSERVHYLSYFIKLHCSKVSTKGAFSMGCTFLFAFGFNQNFARKVLGKYWIISTPKVLYVLPWFWIIRNSRQTAYRWEVQI